MSSKANWHFTFQVVKEKDISFLSTPGHLSQAPNIFLRLTVLWCFLQYWLQPQQTWGKCILSYNKHVAFIPVSYYITTSEDIGRGNKRKDGGWDRVGGGMRAHPWQDVSSVSAHYTTLPENSIRRGRCYTHTHTHCMTKLSAQISFADASSASLLPKNPFWGFRYQDRL